MAVVLVLGSPSLAGQRIQFVLRTAGHKALTMRSARAVRSFLTFSCADILITEDEPDFRERFEAMRIATRHGIPSVLISDRVPQTWGRSPHSHFLPKPCTPWDLVQRVDVLTANRMPLIPEE